MDKPRITNDSLRQMNITELNEVIQILTTGRTEVDYMNMTGTPAPQLIPAIKQRLTELRRDYRVAMDKMLGYVWTDGISLTALRQMAELFKAEDKTYFDDARLIPISEFVRAVENRAAVELHGASYKPKESK